MQIYMLEIRTDVGDEYEFEAHAFRTLEGAKAAAESHAFDFGEGDVVAWDSTCPTLFGVCEGLEYQIYSSNLGD